jgi:hypothetical protein
VVTGTLASPAGGRGRRGAPPADAGAAPATPPPAPAPVAIANGKIAGNSLTFEVAMPARGGGEPMTTKYSGTVTNTVTPWVIGGTITMPGRGGGDPMSIPWTATKQ